MSKVIQNLNVPDIDEIDMGTILMHGVLLPEIREAFTIEQGGPLNCDFAESVRNG